MNFVLLGFSKSFQFSDMPVVYTRTIIPDSMLSVWHATEGADTLLGQLDLDQEDEAIYSSIRNQSRKLQWLGCRMALSHLMQTPEIGIRYNEYGKPLLISGKANISFTHSGAYAAAILSTTSNVGIDLEPVREKISRVAERFLSTQELSLASGKERLEILTLFWSVKETLFKINGKPDLDIQHDICIESFDYLCNTNGTLKARMKWLGPESGIPVSYYRLQDYILAWATVPENN